MARAPKKYSWYTFVSHTDETGLSYRAVKYDNDGEPLGHYTLNERGAQCNCPATVPFCRHKEMLVKFKEMGRIDSGWTYCKELDQWKEPVTFPELDETN